MGFFDRFKNKPASSPAKISADKVTDKSEDKRVIADKKKEKLLKPEEKEGERKEIKKPAVKTGEIKGQTPLAYRVLVKPLITEKASDLGVLGKYVFAVSPKMNKIEVKKAIRTIYKVEPVKINISNFSGKKVRSGRVQGQTKDWKKAIVTLKAGDKIEVYEGV